MSLKASVNTSIGQNDLAAEGPAGIGFSRSMRTYAKLGGYHKFNMEGLIQDPGGSGLAGKGGVDKGNMQSKWEGIQEDSISRPGLWMRAQPDLLLTGLGPRESGSREKLAQFVEGLSEMGGAQGSPLRAHHKQCSRPPHTHIGLAGREYPPHLIRC